MLHATYDITRSYEDNYDRGPLINFEIPKPIHLAPIKLWGYEINSPIGVPAGPLLNSKYIELYAKLGFDLVTGSFHDFRCTGTSGFEIFLLIHQKQSL